MRKFNVLHCQVFFLEAGRQFMGGSKGKVINQLFFQFLIFLFHFSASKSLVPRIGSSSGSATENVLFVNILQLRKTKDRCGLPKCAAKAFCYYPAIISHRPRSQNILKEQALNPEKDSRIKRPRSQVSLEKSSQNYKPLEK
jgi:hypothetical protein